MHLSEYDLAIKDFQAALAISPGNKAAKNQITIANQKKKAIRENEKKVFKGMFSKFAEIDAKVCRDVHQNANLTFVIRVTLQKPNILVSNQHNLSYIENYLLWYVYCMLELICFYTGYIDITYHH